MVKGASNSVENSVLIQTDQRWELLGAGCFGLLLAAKHLYLMLAPLYFFYLLRRYCFIAETKGEDTLLFSLKRLSILAMVTLVCFLGPFIPFVMQSDPAGQMQQIMSRLFPFGRGVSCLLYVCFTSQISSLMHVCYILVGTRLLGC